MAYTTLNKMVTVFINNTRDRDTNVAPNRGFWRSSNL